jgi:Ca2+-binding RTX toxin-like protein
MFGGDGDDWVYGGHNNDTLYGGAGNDHLYGQEDDDWLVGGYDGAGDDVLDGGSGYDTVDYSAALNPVIVNLSTGKAQGGDVGHDTLYSIEHVVGSANNDIIKGTESGIFGIGGSDVLEGGDGADFINGLSGNDSLYGGNGNDSLYGGNGNDSLVGGPGDDYFDGGAGTDTVSFQFATSGVVMAHGGFSAQGPEGTDTFVNVENITGSDFSDDLNASPLGEFVNHAISGLGGNDFIFGASGNDTLLGGEDNDSLHGGSGADKLDGGTGNDLLVGELGADTLTGGSGSDTFLVHIKGFPFQSDSRVGVGQRDVVADFQVGVDKLEVDLPNASGQQVPLLWIGGSAFDGANELRIDHQGGNTILQFNLDTDLSPDMEIQSTGNVNLSPSDFV